MLKAYRTGLTHHQTAPNAGTLLCARTDEYTRIEGSPVRSSGPSERLLAECRRTPAYPLVPRAAGRHTASHLVLTLPSYRKRWFEKSPAQRPRTNLVTFTPRYRILMQTVYVGG